MTKIKPRKGVQLAGIPAAGADVPAELAQEWISAGLATKTTPAKRSPAKPSAPATRDAKEG